MLDHGTQAYDLAAQHYLCAAHHARSCGWHEGEGTALGNLGVVYHELGRLELAVDQHQRALALKRRTGKVTSEAITMGNLGGVYLQWGRLDEAAALHTQALALLGDIDRPSERAHALTNLRHLAGVLHAGGRPADGREAGQAALVIAQDMKNARCEAKIRHRLGAIALSLGDPADAIRHHQQALAHARSSDDAYLLTQVLIDLAAARAERGHYLTASSHAGRALDIASRSGFRVLSGQAAAVLDAIAVKGHRVGDVRRASLR